MLKAHSTGKQPENALNQKIVCLCAFAGQCLCYLKALYMEKCYFCSVLICSEKTPFYICFVINKYINTQLTRLAGIVYIAKLRIFLIVIPVCFRGNQGKAARKIFFER